MTNFFDLLLRDPILLAAGLIVLVTLAILAWALRAWQNLSSVETTEDELLDADESHPVSEPEGAGLTEARLQEMASQLAEVQQRMASLTEINQRLAAIEKLLQEKQGPVQAVELPSFSAELEKLEQHLDDQLQKNTHVDRTQESLDAITRLEAKMEGIHRLLIHLTDSGSSEQQ
jgi:DNA repair exonuclease SbcCD ATPase subunit